MSRTPIKNKQLAKLREFRKGMNLEDFMQDEFKQVLRALQNMYVNSDGSLGGTLTTAVKPSFVAAAGTSGIVSGLSVELTASQSTRVMIMLQGSGSSDLQVFNNSGAKADSKIIIAKNAVTLSQHNLIINSVGATTVSNSIPVSSVFHIDDVTPGTHTYDIRYACITGSLQMLNTYLKVIEV